jgi:hypothetical protein
MPLIAAMFMASMLIFNRMAAGSGSPMALQFAIVLLSASILAVSIKMFKWSIAVSAFGAVLLSQGIWLWLPLTL